MAFRTMSATLALILLGAGPVYSQQTGQPASDVLMSFDIWGNPTPRGGVTNGGTNSHSVW